MSGTICRLYLPDTLVPALLGEKGGQREGMAFASTEALQADGFANSAWQEVR